jgi:hypothetical protein
MMRAKKRLEERPIYWSELRWPLIEQFGWTRGRLPEIPRDEARLQGSSLGLRFLPLP